MARKKSAVEVPKLFKVSQSKVKTYQMCRHAYHLKYVEKLRKRKIKRPFQFGSLVHKMLEANANGEDAFAVLDNIPLKEQKLFRAEREMYGDLITDIRFIMTDYFKYWKDSGLKPIVKENKGAEHEFNIEVSPGILFTGKIDQVSRTPNKLRWLMEHKSFGRSIPKPDHLWRNLQSCVYIRALDILGWKPVDGVLWDYIFSKPPSRLKITKAGAVSKVKMNTLPSAVRYGFKQYGLDPEEHKKILQSSIKNRKNYFHRIFTPVNRSVVDNIYDGFIDTAREIADNHGKSSTRTFGRHCEWCDFEPLCRAGLTGADVDYLKEKDYYVEVKVEEEKIIIESED